MVFFDILKHFGAIFDFFGYFRQFSTVFENVHLVTLPLGFDAKQMYEFISQRFHETSVEVQRQALQWLQILCLLNVHIPLNILFEMFSDGILTLHKGQFTAACLHFQKQQLFVYFF